MSKLEIGITIWNILGAVCLSVILASVVIAIAAVLVLMPSGKI